MEGTSDPRTPHSRTEDYIMFVKKSLAATLLLSCALAPLAAVADNNAALVARFDFSQTEPGCGIPTDRGGEEVSSAQIVSSGQGGESHLRCSGEVTPPIDGRAWRDQDFDCFLIIQDDDAPTGTSSVCTTDSRVRISASGRASMDCFYTVDGEDDCPQ